jgi:hypothetical protein
MRTPHVGMAKSSSPPGDDAQSGTPSRSGPPVVRQDFDATVPNVALVYDCLLGRKDNFSPAVNAVALWPASLQVRAGFRGLSSLLCCARQYPVLP